MGGVVGLRAAVRKMNGVIIILFSFPEATALHPTPHIAQSGSTRTGLLANPQFHVRYLQRSSASVYHSPSVRLLASLSSHRSPGLDCDEVAERIKRAFTSRQVQHVDGGLRNSTNHGVYVLF